MRIAISTILALCVACSGGSTKPKAPEGAAGGYTATRWVPGNASFVLTARTVREAQQGVRNLVETVLPLTGLSVDELSRELGETLQVDPLSPDGLANIGIDLEGGVAVFSDNFNPTIVARLSSAPAFRAFIERQPNLKMQSVVDGGVEVFTANLRHDARISWAIADDWLWVHVKLPDALDDSATWFAASRKPSAPTWTAELSASTPVAGFLDLAKYVGDFTARHTESPRGRLLLTCLKSLPVGRVSLALAGDAKQANARIAMEIGPRINDIVAAKIPAGFAAAAAQAPLAVQLNVGARFVRDHHPACFEYLRIGEVTGELGIDAGRGYLRTFDPDNKDGSGAVALDLAHPRYIEAQLGKIPLRSAFERSRTFEGMKGKALSIPTFPTIEYVLQPTAAFAGIGEGQLSTMIGNGAPVAGPLFDITAQPPGLSIESWTALLELLDIDDAKPIATRLQNWRQLRVNLTIEGTRLVLAATGTRR